MLPILGLVALGAALGALLYYLLKGKGKGKDSNSEEKAPSPFSGPMPFPEDEDPEPPHPKARRRTDAAIDEIANRIQFSSGQASIRDMVPSQTPTANVTVRPIRSITELPQMLPSQYGLDDDQFYGRLATGQISVLAYEEQEPENSIVLLLQDTSGSMEREDRSGWSVRLNRRIIKRADAENAQVALLTFTSTPRDWHIADSTEERAALSSELDELFSPSGGTDVVSPLEKGLELLSSEKFTVRRIVLVTDGDGIELDVKAMRRKLADLNAELHTVCIGKHNPDLEAISTHYDLLVD